MEFLFLTFLAKPLWLWLMFLTIVVTLMAFDLGVLHRDNHELGVAESLKLSAFYIFIAILFGGYIWWAWSNGTLVTSDGTNPVASYFQGYIIEKVLSIDNVFVISLIFGYFAIPRKYQYRALVWGIIGVIVLRGVMIAIGTELISAYSWVTLVFAAFLAFTGIKMLVMPEGETDISQNPVVTFVSRHMNVTKELHGQKFFVRQTNPATGRLMLYATPLLVALIVINVADLIFAVDSVPAIFLITTDTFIVYTANIMAILGLRALYFALAALVHRFHYLKYALAVVLIFIGLKGFYSHFFGKFDPFLSLGITVGIIAAGIAYSLWKTSGKGDGHDPQVKPAEQAPPA
ncbi:TerC family protein [Rhodobacter calidifons]|uniref:TerC family protein n=1 Tax=Rhodobacter calidifons TaxID=2715277 RepID=A0ABX0G6S6_9RHOB|nr:TerC family protein [Rhodobacter calidifons]NHB76563.1 TerC family protein [Rhodobacter calidifons]